MVPRVFNMLHATSPAQARRLDLALLRGGTVLIVLTLVLWNVPFDISGRASASAGAVPRQTLRVFYWGSIFLLAYLADNLNRDAVGDAVSGYLSLVAMTGTSTAEWTVLRLTQIWSGFMSVWVVRLPFLCFFYTLGGMRIGEYVALEIMLLAIFAAASSRTMLTAHHGQIRKSSGWSGVAAILVIEVILLVGVMITSLFSYSGRIFPGALAVASEALSRMSLYNQMISFPSAGQIPTSFLWTAVPYSLFAIYWIRKYSRQVYARIGETPLQNLQGTKSDQKALRQRAPLPRCWDDALAWQCYVYREGGSKQTLLRLVMYTVVLIVIGVCLATGSMHNLLIVVLIGTQIALLQVMNSPPRCFDNEVKAQTLSSLILTPHTELEFYRGWRRGSLWLAIPDYGFAILFALIMATIYPLITFILLGTTALAFASGPLFMLSGLVPISFSSLWTGFVVIAGLTGVIFLATVIGTATALVVIPIVAIPLYWGFNQILLRFFVKSWMKKKIDAEL